MCYQIQQQGSEQAVKQKEHGSVSTTKEHKNAPLFRLWLIVTPHTMQAISCFKPKAKVEHRKLKYMKQSEIMAEVLIMLLIHSSMYKVW